MTQSSVLILIAVQQRTVINSLAYRWMDVLKPECVNISLALWVATLKPFGTSRFLEMASIMG